MAVLTKVRVPVSDIARISNGTTAADIASSGADITETVSGALVGTWGTGGLTIPAAKVLTAKQVTGETVLLATAAGASATVKTTGTKLQVGTTSAHVMELLANAVLGLSVGTDGKVTLGVQGTAGGHLVNKTYVDSVASSAATTVATIAGTGQISIPNSTGNNLIVKWGQTNGSGQLTQVTFAVAFPNAIFVAFANEVHNINASSDGAKGVYDLQLAGFKFNQANDSARTNPWCWLAIGF
jgi:hypothetical protein